MAHNARGQLGRVCRRAPFGDRPALRFKRDGRYLDLSWTDYRRQVDLTAAGLVNFGIGAGDAVAILSENRHEWLIADLAILAVGAVNVPLGRIDAGGVIPNDDFLPVMLALFAKDAKLVVGCKSGRSSLRAMQILATSGFTCLVEQRAGWDGARDAFGQLIEPGWWRAGLPTEQGTPSGRCYGDLAARAQRSFARS